MRAIDSTQNGNRRQKQWIRATPRRRHTLGRPATPCYHSETAVGSLGGSAISVGWGDSFKEFHLNFEQIYFLFLSLLSPSLFHSLSLFSTLILFHQFCFMFSSNARRPFAFAVFCIFFLSDDLIYDWILTCLLPSQFQVAIRAAASILCLLLVCCCVCD